jgi:hypothetical protein
MTQHTTSELRVGVLGVAPDGGLRIVTGELVNLPAVVDRYGLTVVDFGDGDPVRVAPELLVSFDQ